MSEYLIYGIQDIAGNILYVGITNDLERRKKQHLKDESNTDKYIFLKTNPYFFMVLDTAYSKTEAEDKETRLIKHYKRYNTLFNVQKVNTKQEKIDAAIKACKARILAVSKGE